MKEIKCPHCGKQFTIDESGYQEILSQIKNHEIEERVKLETKALTEKLTHEKDLALVEEQNKATANKQALLDQINKLQSDLLAKQSEAKLELEKAKASSEAELVKLRNELANIEDKQKLALKDALEASKKTIAELEAKLNGEADRQQLAVVQAVSSVKDELKEKELEIEKLNTKIVENQKNHDIIIKDKDEQIAHYKDFKASLSTKMIGESLEQHCSNEFNRLRPLAFPKAYFEKDNDDKEGSKGDFIYRDYDEDGTEYVSIMFEMKNEMEGTATKHKNADFFKKLDHDRTSKKCEYAVLVSLLEADNEYYSQGIVDVSYEAGYPKMYVIRPNFFIPFLTMIRNSALNTVEVRKQLSTYQQENIDVTNFEEKLAGFQEAFSKNYDMAHKKFDDAITQIDASIKTLQKIKDNLLASDKYLERANSKAQDITIKKLTRGNPTMSEKFKEAAENKKATIEMKDASIEDSDSFEEESD